MGAASAAFTGPVSIGGGTIVMAATNALGPATATTPITIANNAALDIVGNVIGTRPVSVQGAGPDGVSGAIISSATADQLNAFLNVTLTGNTTFGGTGRWDIRGTSASLAGGGYTLTKTGTNSVYLVGLGNTNLGALIVNGGNLGLQGTTIVGNSSTLAPITVNAGGTLSAWGISAAVANNIALNGGTVGTVATDAGNVTFSGAVTVGSSGGYLTATSTGTTTFSGQILGPGLVDKTGTSGTVILTGTTNSWSGGTTVNGGTLQIGTGIANGSLPDVVGTTITLGSVVTVSGTTTSYNGTLFINSANNTNLLNTVITTAAGGTAVGNLTVNGSGIVTLGQANTYNGTSQVGATTALSAS